jgi:hypothetical protein
MPPAVEFWNEYSVPEIDILIIGFDCLRRAHEQDPFERHRGVSWLLPWLSDWH